MIRILSVFGLTAVAMIAIFRAAGRHADTAAMQGYCDNPDLVLRSAGIILSGNTRDFRKDRRGYVVASKRIFPVPRRAGESEPAHLLRLRGATERSCP